MRFLPLLLTCVALPLAAFAQEAGGTDTAASDAPVAAAPDTPAAEETAPARVIRSPEGDVVTPLIWPFREKETKETEAPAAESPEPAASEAFNATAIWGGEGLEQCMVRPWIDAFGDCLASLGAGEEAVRFADALKNDPDVGMSGIMRAFFETGDVDVALVDFPALANSNRQVVFLNGKDPIILAQSLETTPPETRAAQALLADHPAAMSAGPRDYLVARDFTDGSQRFVLMDRVTDACRACPVLALEVVFADFKGGELTGVSTGGWLPPDLDTDALGKKIAAGDMTALQTQLILRGYDVGGADGIDGPLTQAAQTAFLDEHCLEGEAGQPLTAAARSVLVDGALGRCPSH